MKEVKGIIHGSFFVRNKRKEHLSSLFGLAQGTDMDVYDDYEFDKEGQLTVIHRQQTEGQER